MKQSDIQRARASLQTERTRLREERTRFEAEVRAFGRERPEIVEVVKLLTARFGTDGWRESANLAEVLRHCLLEPLLDRDADYTRQLSEAQAQIRRLLIQMERAPARPVIVTTVAGSGTVPSQGVPGHTTAADQVQLAGRPGYRGACSCTWRGAVTRNEQAVAIEDANIHARAQLNAPKRYA